MMANTVWREIHATCPFYLRSADRVITCDLDGCECKNRFNDASDCAEHYRKHCARLYKRCPLYQKINKTLDAG